MAAVEIREAPWAEQQRYTDEAIFAALRRAAKGRPMSHQAYAKRRREGEPSGVRIMQRFGGWNPAMEAAGLPVHKRRRSYRRQFDEAACLSAVREARLIAQIAFGSDRLTFHRYGQVAQLCGLPSPQTIRNRLGKWSEVLSQV